MRKIAVITAGLFLFKNTVAQNVGIGISNPNVKLHIIDGTPATLANSTGFLLIGENRFANIVADSNRFQARYNGAAAPLSLQPFGGNIGVGNITNAPASKLQIAGGAEVGINLHGSLLIGETTSANMAFDANEIQARSNASTATSLYLQSMGGNSIFSSGNIIANGKIGIGQANPNVPLHIEGGIDASLTAGGYVQFGPSNGANLIIDNNEIMARNDSGTATLTLQNNGGKTLIGEDIEINGNIQGAVKLEQNLINVNTDAPFTITVGNKSYIYLTTSSSLCNEPLNNCSNAKATLTNGEAIGQILVLQSGGGIVWLIDNPIYNLNLHQDRGLARDNTIVLFWSGIAWLEIAFSAN